MSRSRASASSSALLGAGLAGIAFGAAGGTELERTGIVELLVVLLGAAVACAAILYGRRGPLHGGPALVLLAALTAFSGLSILWSTVPELSFADTGRMLAYLALFAAAMGGARLAPRGSPVVLRGVLLAAVAVVLYALASRVWPGALAEHELSNRVGQPFGYWNAVATTAALAVPAGLWLGARRGGSALERTLAYPALGLCFLTIALTQSRGGLAAAALGAAAWFALVPLRLRSLPVLLAPALLAAPVAAWALSKEAFSDSQATLAARESVAGELGLLVLVLVAALLVTGLAIGSAEARGLPPMRLRRRIGVAAGIATAAVPLVLFTSVAFSDKGIGGTVDELTDEKAAQPSEGAARFTAASNSRASFWREAGDVFDVKPLIGTGDATFAVSRLRFRKNEQVSRHAHGFIPQTMADLGLVGVALSLALLAAWLVAAARAGRLYPRRIDRFLARRSGSEPPLREWSGERVALVTLTLVAVVFGLQSLIDWTWFVPGPSAMAIVAAGFVAGRGPFGSTPSGETLELRSLRDLPRPDRPRIVAAAALAIIALLFAWSVWQPVASDRKSDGALELIEDGQPRAAIAEAESAADANPLAPKPLLVKASAQTAAGDEPGAQRTLERAVLRYPGDPQTWLRLASFQLGTLDQPVAALGTLRGLLYLDPESKAGRRLFLDSRNRLRAKQAAELQQRVRALRRRQQQQVP